MNWQPIETAPEQPLGDDILLWIPGSGAIYGYRNDAATLGGKMEWLSAFRETPVHPTHWLEITPPEEV